MTDRDLSIYDADAKDKLAKADHNCPCTSCRDNRRIVLLVAEVKRLKRVVTESPHYIESKRW